MDDIKLKFDNLVTAIEYMQANSLAEFVTVNSVGHGNGIQISFMDKTGKSCTITVFAGNVTPEVTSTSKIYRKKI